MRFLRQSALALLALLFLATGPLPTARAEGSAAAPAVSAEIPTTNAEIRAWYNRQVEVIPALNTQWITEGLSAEARARKAADIRHHARLQARAYMPNKAEVADLQARDQKKYGNPDGPTFESLVDGARGRGLTGDAVYEDIIRSSSRTDAGYNERFGVKPKPASP